MTDQNTIPEYFNDKWVITYGEKPAPLLSYAATPNHHVVFFDFAGNKCGTLTMRDGRIDFDGNATESAKRFFEAFGKMFTQGGQ
jgi:hypothetical protein